MRAIVATPAPRPAGPPRPAVLLLAGLAGIGASGRRLATRFAEAGYVTLLPELRGSTRAEALARALGTLGGLDAAASRTLDDVEAAARCLVGLDDVSSTRTAVVGLSIDGGLALRSARAGGFAATAVFYGDVRPGEAHTLRGLPPVVAGFGARDRLFGHAGHRLEAALAALGVPRDIVTYPTAGHGYLTPHPGLLGELGRRSPLHVAYDKHAAADSWLRMLGFFGEHLAPRRGADADGGASGHTNEGQDAEAGPPGTSARP